MPGTDPMEAMRVIADELPRFPYLPELPGRGPGADSTGRTAALLIDIPVEVTLRGWRLAERPGRDLARARSMLANDLDVMEEVLQGYAGPLKIQVCGPWTLAATLELTRTMDAALRDAGAVADLTTSLAEATAAYAKDVAKRVPQARVITQIDEPALSAIADGRVPTASGLSRIRAIEQVTIIDRLGEVLASTTGYTVVHCCDTSVRFEIMFVGVGTGGTPKETAERVARLWQRMGSSPDAEQTVITPPCGLADNTPAQAAQTLKLCREAAAILPELGE
jgi:methionine synthase II (cobalamin-independent)